MITKSKTNQKVSVFGYYFNQKTLIFVLIASTLIAYFPTLSNGFTYYSDDNYVLTNTIIQNLSWHNIVFIFTSYFDGHYHPLTLISLGISYCFGGNNPFLYQLTNVLFHIVNSLLVFLLAKALLRNIESAFIVIPLISKPLIS